MNLPGIDVLRRGKKDQRADPFRARFCALAKIYCQPSNMILQGDLEATQRQKKDTVLSKIFQEEAGLEEVCDLAKYGPIKDHLVAAYQKIRRPAQEGRAQRSVHDACTRFWWTQPTTSLAST